MKENDTNIKVPFISKLAYGMGDVGCNFSWMFVGNFLMIFYTDVFGISMSAVAALMLFSRFWDAINDPIVGGLTDSTNTRWGRYRPWLLIAAPLTAVVLIASFWAHPDWNDTVKIVYMIITYCILVLGYTCVNIPYGTLCGAMTQNIEERAKINTFRSVSAMIAIGVINIITIPLISKLGNGSDQQGYLLVAILYGIIFALCHIFCFAKTKEAAADLSRQVQTKMADKFYYAVTDGVPEQKKGTLEDYLLRDGKTNTSKVVSKSTEGAKSARLDYEVTAQNKTNAILRKNRHCCQRGVWRLQDLAGLVPM